MAEKSNDSEKYKYQLNFSSMYPDDMYDKPARLQKANKAISVLKDHLGDLKKLDALDLGCSTGIMTNYYSPHFNKITGIDIDESGVEFARKNKLSDNSEFIHGDGMNTGLKENSFDVVFCSHVYEHIPDPDKLMNEIKRILKPKGVCYFAAGNRFVWKDGEYRLPLLSVVPKSIAHLYLKILGKGDYYYETAYTYWELKKLVKNFYVIDYTKKVIADPVKYYATEMITPGSLRQKIYLFILLIAYWICPGYIWLLKKNNR